MRSNNRKARGVGMAVGAALAAALAATPGVASADPSTDPFSWIGGLDLGDLSVAAPAATLDMQVSIDGTDLFSTAGNTATATSDMGDIAIAIGNSAHASAIDGTGDFAFADGANSIADAVNGSFDSAVVFGANSTAVAGDGGPGDYDLAAAFGDMLHASAIGLFQVDIVP